MNKVINMQRTVYEICNEYPEAAEVLYKLGFEDIIKPGMLNTAGRFMTISMGASMKKIDIEVIKKSFQEAGYKLIE